MMLNPVIKLTVLLLFLHSMVIAQSDTTYFDQNWEKTTRDSASFFRPQPIKVDDDHFLVKDYYMSSGKLEMKAVSLDVEADTIDGIAYWYYENGELKEEVNYKKGYRKGVYKKYTDGGKLILQANYKLGLLVGDIVGYDSLNNNISFTGEFFFGNRSGWFTWYYADGVTPQRAVKYSYGRVKKAYNYSLKGEEMPFDSVYTLSGYSIGYADINDYLDHQHVFRAFKKKHKKLKTCFHVRVYFDEYGQVKRWKLENNDTKEYQELVKSVFSVFPRIGKSVFELNRINGEYTELMHIKFRDFVKPG